MIAWHHGLTASHTDHGLVGHEDVFHQLLFLSITSATVAEVVFRTGTDTLLQVALLQALDEGYTHHCRQVAVLAVRLLQTVEAWSTANVDHRRERQHTTHLPHGCGRLTRFHLSQLGIERTGLTNLLRVDGSATGVDTRQHLFVEQCRNAVGSMVHQPVLNGCHTITQHVGIHLFLTGKLREVTDTIGYQLTALGGVQLSLLVEELVHIHASQLGDTLFLRHLAVKLIHLLLQIGRSTTSCEKCGHAHHLKAFHCLVSNFCGSRYITVRKGTKNPREQRYVMSRGLYLMYHLPLSRYFITSSCFILTPKGMSVALQSHLITTFLPLTI